MQLCLPQSHGICVPSVQLPGPVRNSSMCGTIVAESDFASAGLAVMAGLRHLALAVMRCLVWEVFETEAYPQLPLHQLATHSI